MLIALLFAVPVVVAAWTIATIGHSGSGRIERGNVNHADRRSSLIMGNELAEASMSVESQAAKKQLQLLVGLALGCATIATFGARSQTAPGTPTPQELPRLIRSVKGTDLFRSYCASCHGLDAKGNGPAAEALKPKVPDLTVLAKNNGGEFPEEHVRKTIMGDDALAAHGSRQMPIWGPVFHQIEEDVDRGPVRLANLVQYLKSIQALK